MLERVIPTVRLAIYSFEHSVMGFERAMLCSENQRACKVDRQRASKIDQDTPGPIELFVYPNAWPEHIQWLAFICVLPARRPGALSLDALIFKAVGIRDQRKRALGADY
jgi:hypothetical protein